MRVSLFRAVAHSQKTDSTLPKKHRTCFTVRALITFEASDSEESGVRHQAPTLIGCLFVKELAQPALPFCAAASSAAEKRDYEELSTFRQQVFLLRRHRLTPRIRPPCCLAARSAEAVCVARGRILSQPKRAGKRFFVNLSSLYGRGAFATSRADDMAI